MWPAWQEVCCSASCLQLLERKQEQQADISAASAHLALLARLAGLSPTAAAGLLGDGATAARWLRTVLSLVQRCSMVHPELLTALELLHTWCQAPALSGAVAVDGQLHAQLLAALLRTLRRSGGCIGGSSLAVMLVGMSSCIGPSWPLSASKCHPSACPCSRFMCIVHCI